MSSVTVMTDARVEQVMKDVACPGCEYNLRGLHGPVVECPECGVRCDVAQLVHAKWEMAWYQAPKFNHVTGPVSWAVMAPIVAMIVSGVVALSGVPAMPTAVVTTLLYMVVYACSFRMAYRVFDDWRGVWMALLAHLIFAAYFGVVLLTVLLLIGLLTGGGWSALVTGPLLVGVAVGAYFGRRGERWIAGQCIREYLRRKSAAASNTG